MIRNKKGKFARNKSKDTVAVLLTIFIATSVAYTAQGVTKDYDTAGKELINQMDEHSGQPTENDLRNCITTGEGTGRIESYCADTGENLIRAIRAEWGGQGDTPSHEEKNDRGQTASSERGTRDTHSYQRKASNPEIEAIIRQEAEAQGYEDIELALDIVDCESRFNPKATNSWGNTPSWSIDEGLWMYNNWWQRFNITSECAFDLYCSTKQAIKDLKAGKANQWACYKIVRP
jgi:hypothetical protein